MSRKLNIGFAALIAMVVFAAAFAISHHAGLPDARSCLGKTVENIRQNGLGAKVGRSDCRRGVH